jgi:hypothetical protein
MNFNKKQVFVALAGQSLKTSGLSSTLSAGQLAILNTSMTCVSAAPTYSSHNYIHFALGTDDDSLGSLKSNPINPKRVTKYFGFAPSTSTTGQVQITYIGYDEVDATKSPTMDCGTSYAVGIHLWETYNKALSPQGMRRDFVVQTDCCEDCAGCGSANCGTTFARLADLINADPYVSTFITASAVGTPSAPALNTTFSITLPDAGTNAGGVLTTDFEHAGNYTNGTTTGVTGTASASGTGAIFTIVVAGTVITSVTATTAGSGYVIGETILILGTALAGGATPAEDITLTVTATDAASDDVLTALRTNYASFVTDAEADIVYTADTDGDGDADSTGNSTFVMTPLSSVALGDLPPYNGVFWSASTADSTNTACGLKLVGKALALETNTCVPEAWPYAPRTVRFKVFAGENPEQVQDADVNWACSPWSVTTTQEVTFPVGAGYLVAEMERENVGYLLQNRVRYFDPTWNDGSVPLFANSADTYYIYYVEYQDNYYIGSYQDASQDLSLAVVCIPYNSGSGTAVADAFETILDSYITTSNTALAAVNIA